MNFFRYTVHRVSLLLFLFLATSAQADKHLSDVEFYGYKVTHHMGAIIKHIEKFGFNAFDHPPMPDHRFFVITPALDHFYSKAVIDTRWGPVVVDTPARDERYASLLVTDMEHFGIYAEVTEKAGQRFVVVHEDYQGAIPKGTVIRTKSDFPLIFLRTQSFAFNQDKLADGIRRQALIHGAWQAADLPNEKDPKAIINWTMKHSKRYPETKALMEQAAESYDAATHKETFDYVFSYLQTGQVTGSTGMFDAIDSPTGANHLVRAAGTLLGHLGFPTHHAYYQNTPVDRQGRVLDGENGPFVLTIPYDPGVDLFWSVTRYDNKTRLPLNPADIGGNNIQAYNAFNTEPDKNGNVTITFSHDDPKDNSYWMPVTDDYYFISRYYGPNKKMNGNTVHDILFKGTKLESKFQATRF
ncbi:MAG: DUF1254 domain-containing protein [Candidatus Thiodiazotropha taylori]|nr:DUF1254 domain-containing protein [Candidatus Thiodiazotropha taylori]MCG7936366.1 DUF1254 domain-containing protein [Candidatus Thiodiazotropha taylori]MCG7972187.1 DUF1254 domain-containing protein [Candidatus Thiodiazotropha taylori]